MAPWQPRNPETGERPGQRHAVVNSPMATTSARALLRRPVDSRHLSPVTIPALLCLYVLDALVLVQGFVAMGLLAALVFVVLPKWFVLRRLGRSCRSTRRFAALLLICAVAVMVTIKTNNRLAHSRADSLIAAIAHYRAVAGDYPQTLGDLVPTYIDAVPRARYSLTFNRFSYRHTHAEAALAYADVPPFGRAIFEFGPQRWLRLPPRTSEE